MEIKTTMVKFYVAKKQMAKSTDDAFLFDLGNDKVWVPRKKVIVRNEDENINEVIMPRWVFFKTILPLYFKVEEFIHTTEVNYNHLKK